MNLHEHQSKSLFRKFNIPVPEGEAAFDVNQALTIAKQLGGNSWIVKAQVHAGGRGKAGGVKIVKGEEELEQAVTNYLGSTLVTHQTDADGLPISRVLVESLSDIDREIYLGALIDRGSRRIVFMASAEGGMDIEEVAATQPEKILKVAINPVVGLQPYQTRQIAFGLGLVGDQIKQLAKIMANLYRIFTERDVSLIEINPLIVTGQGDLLALDAKIGIDDNALYRQPEIVDLRDTSQENARELEADAHGLNYVSLDGNIGCMVNGAGLAMATMDEIKLQGGEPANFLDVGGGTTAEKVAEAFKLILSDAKVKAILVNIFGGIVRCDLIADGIIQAVKEVGVEIPVVVRLEGTNVDQGKALLAQSDVEIIAADDLQDGAQKAVAAIGGGQ
ncbi:MAG: ADP-forming succinate--CoA ligase subunit beta [Gammaproteobacteria bacterium]|nr:ADP-forming succinate--CoA ligase subunit beta [Gammaproteobacteria bacterium]